MNKIIRLTESDLHRIVKESVYRILQEDGLGGATSCAGVYDTPSSTGTYEGGKAQSKEVTDYPLGGVIRKGHNLGNPTKKKEKGIDMTPATDRSGGKNHSIAINYVGESAIHEAVEEGIGNWLKGAALGGMMALSPMQANAQTQNYNPQQNDTVQVSKSNFSKETNRELTNRIARNMKNAGMSDKDINTEINSMSNFNVAWRNSRGEQNTQIKEYLSSINPTHSTENIHVSRGSGNSELNQLFNGMNKSTAMKYKAFILPDEVYVVMPVNYTLQDVQAELGL